jgi:hypothetical protein
VAVSLETKTYFSPVIYKLFLFVQIAHGALVFVTVYLFYWYILSGGLAHELYTNNGEVSQYRAQTLDAIPKCSTPEYLYNNQSKCGAIPGEYVTFTCNIDAFSADDFKLVWISNKQEIKNNEKYVILIDKTYEQSTGSYVYSSTLVINDINESDFQLYSCIAVMLSEQHFVFHETIHLVKYEVNEISVRTFPGYFVNLKNIYSLTFNDSIVNTAFHVIDSRGLNIKAVSPFINCLPSIQMYHSLHKNKISQVPNAKFCPYLTYVKYVLRIKFKSGRILVHPTSIIIEPAIQNDFIEVMHYTSYNQVIGSIGQSMFESKETERPLTKDNCHVLFYIVMHQNETILLSCISITIAVLFIIELLWYICTRTIMIKHEDSIRKRSVGKEFDLFLFFCENETDDSEFAIDILQPKLKRDDFTILSCDTVNPGHLIHEKYRTKIRKCKKVLVIISDNFLNDNDCDFFLRIVLPSLFHGKVLDKNDIITVWNKCEARQINTYGVLKNGLEVTVEGRSEEELERVTDIIEKSMNEDISHNILFRCMFKIICLMHGLYTVMYEYRFKTASILCILYITYLLCYV